MLPGRRASAAFVVAIVAGTTAACGGDDAPAQLDAALVDGPPIDVPDDCDPATLYFAGELLDWDATMANPKGVADAAITQRGDATKTGTTSATGSFELCIANDPNVIVDVVPPIGSDTVAGLALVAKDVIAAGGAFTIRTFAKPRAVTDYGFDDTKAHVYVRVNTAARAISVSATSERSYVFDGVEWRPGEDTGQDVYIANVDAANGETKLLIDRAVVGAPTNIPLEAGKLTYVVVNATN